MGQLLIRIFEIDDNGNQEELARGTITDKESKFRELREGGETFLSPITYNEEKAKYPWEALVIALSRSRVGRCLKRTWHSAA